MVIATDLTGIPAALSFSIHCDSIPVPIGSVTPTPAIPNKLFKYHLPRNVWTDPDGDFLRFEAYNTGTIITASGWLKFNAAEGLFSGTPVTA
jgi:hypothetical protein